VNGNPGNVVANQLDFTRVQAGVGLATQLTHVAEDGKRTTNSARRCIEDGKHTVSSGLHQSTPMSLDLTCDCVVVHFEKFSPPPVTHRDRLLGRPDEVGVQDDRKRTLCRRGLFADGAGHEPLDFVRQHRRL